MWCHFATAGIDGERVRLSDVHAYMFFFLSLNFIFLSVNVREAALPLG